MKHWLIASVAALGLVTAASAQTSTTTTTTTTGTATTGSVTISPEVRTKVREYVVKEKRPSVAAPSGFSVSAGATLPQSVELHSFPADVGVTEYRYTVVGDLTVLVDPSSRRIIQVIE